MPPVKSTSSPVEVPGGLKVFKFHKVDDLRWIDSDKEAIGTCPFCGTGNKFAVNKISSKYQCFVCGVKGNEHTFVREVWQLSLESTKNEDYARLVEMSRFVDIESCRDWGIAKHMLTDEWCVPGYNKDGKVTGLYRFVHMKDKDEWHWKLLPSPNLGHHVFGLNLYEEQKPIVYLCEGWRDAIKLYEVLKHTTTNGVSWLTDVNVLSVPGTNSFKLEWTKYFQGKQVCILFDNDYPKKNPKTGEEMIVGGRAGVARVASMLQGVASSVEYLAWGGRRGHKGYTEDFPNGHDIRDFLTADA